MQVLLTLEEVALLCHVSTMSIRRWWESGKFPAPIRLGNRLRWKPETIADFLDSQNTHKETV